MVKANQIAGLKIYQETDIKQGERFAIPLPAWIGGSYDEHFYLIEIADRDLPVTGITFKPYVVPIKDAINWINSESTERPMPDASRHEYAVFDMETKKVLPHFGGCYAGEAQRWFKDRKDADELRERYVERYAECKVPAENFRIIERDVTETFRFSAT
jgi:hypothetical protein